MKQITRYIMSLVALLALTAGAWAQDTYNVTFKANGNTVTVENVTLPHTFRCDFYNSNGELDLIIQELYGFSEGYCDQDNQPSSDSENVTCGLDGRNHFITVSAPFDGTATVTGKYTNYNSGNFFDYSLEITCPLPASDEITVTPVTGKTNEWTFQMPASNVEVEVEYFTQDELDQIADVVNAINELPETLPETLTTYDKVKDASDKYDALSDEAKALVTNADKLTAAKEKFAPYESPAGTIYNSGSISLTALQPGDVLMKGVSLTGETTDKVGLQRLALDGEKKDGQFVLSLEYMTPLLGENAAVTSGSMVFTPIAEDGNAGDAWIVFDGSDIADATVWLNGINSASATIIGMAKAAVAQINNLPTTLTNDEATKNAIAAARAAVTALGENSKLIDDADTKKLTDAEKAYAAVEEIGKIGTVANSPECKQKIDAARKAYDGLTDDQKAKVSNVATLETSEKVFNAIADIDAIGDVAYTEDCKQKIEAAKTSCEALTPEELALVTNYETFTTAKQAYEDLETQVNDAKELIEAIGEVENTPECKQKIDAAREAYEALNDDQKAAFDPAALQTLADAEQALVEQTDKELTEAIDASENYYATIEKKYPDEAAELLEAIITATMVKANADATQEQVNDAIKALAKVEKKTTLKVNVKEAEEYCESIEEKYPDIVPALTEGINSAKDVAANPDATTQQVEAALEKLASYKTTAENEVLAEAKGKLTADISTADDYAASIEEKYPEIAASFSEAVKGAKDVLDNVDATQQEVDDAIAIVAAAKSTAEGEVLTESKKELSNAITDADDYAASIEEKYPETAASLLEAISGTKDVADKADATQQEIDDAIAIVAAAKATAEQQVLSDTKTELNNDINKAMRYYISIKNSNPNAAATLLDAIVAARAILEDGDATQQDADAALSDIVKALQDAEQATGISLVEAEAYAKKMQNAKVIIGGKLYIFNNGKMYDANGSAVE